jgi:hypothetical protein
MKIEQFSREAAAALAAGNCDRKDFCLVFDQPRHNETREFYAHYCAVRDHVPVEQQALDLLFAPAPPERHAVQRCDGGCIARVCFRQDRLAAREKIADETDHRRAS